MTDGSSFYTGRKLTRSELSISLNMIFLLLHSGRKGENELERSVSEKGKGPFLPDAIIPAWPGQLKST